jgi:hypothetical protein
MISPASPKDLRVQPQVAGTNGPPRLKLCRDNDTVLVRSLMVNRVAGASAA